MVRAPKKTARHSRITEISPPTPRDAWCSASPSLTLRKEPGVTIAASACPQLRPTLTSRQKAPVQYRARAPAAAESGWRAPAVRDSGSISHASAAHASRALATVAWMVRHPRAAVAAALIAGAICVGPVPQAQQAVFRVVLLGTGTPAPRLPDSVPARWWRPASKS